MRGSKRYSMPSRPGTWSSTSLSWALRSCSRPAHGSSRFANSRHQRGRLGWLEAVRRSKDPTVFTVLFEDAVDTEHDLEGGQRQKARPDFRIAYPIHRHSPSTLRAEIVGSSPGLQDCAICRRASAAAPSRPQTFTE